MVLVVAGRRRGELVPSKAAALVGNVYVAGIIGGLFFVGVLLHGLVIWHAPVARAAAFVVAGVMAGSFAGAWRLGAFRRRTVIELRAEPERDLGAIEVTAAGEQLDPSVLLDGRALSNGSFERFSQLRVAVVDLPEDAPAEIHVWAHRVSRDGGSAQLSVEVDVHDHRVVIRP